MLALTVYWLEFSDWIRWVVHRKRLQFINSMCWGYLFIVSGRSLSVGLAVSAFGQRALSRRQRFWMKGVGVATSDSRYTLHASDHMWTRGTPWRRDVAVLNSRQRVSIPLTPAPVEGRVRLTATFALSRLICCMDDYIIPIPIDFTLTDYNHHDRVHQF